MSEPIVDHFLKALERVEHAGYGDEIEWARNLKPMEQQTLEDFKGEYAFAVFSSSGLREQHIRPHYNKFIEAYERGESNAYDHIFNRRMKAAIIHTFDHADIIFKKLLEQPSDGMRIEYLGTLPQIGKKEKFHLARNLGIDCVKPDFHMEDLAARFGFKTPLEMCKEIQGTIPEKLGVIDVILWRDCNLNGVRP